MHTFKLTSISFIAVLFSLLLVACSESNSESSSNQAPLIKPVTTPYILDNALYEFNPINELSTKLAESESSVWIDIDSDKATANKIEDPLIPLIDYFIYVKSQSIWAYELKTRRHHLLLNISDISSTIMLCEMKHIKTIDQILFENASTIKVKDERGFYLSTSESSCEDKDSLSYYRLEIADSFTDTFDIREEITDDEEACETECPVETRTYPILVGKLRSSEEALMGSGTPIISTDGSQFGYLGLDSSSNTLKFFIGNAETKRKELLWQLQSNGFQAQSDTLASFFHFQTKDSVLIYHGYNLVEFSLLSIFDDDRGTNRLSALQNPIFESNSSYHFKYNNLYDSLYIQQDNKLYFISRAQNELPQLIRDYSINGLSSIDIFPFSGSLLVKKNYNDDEISINALNINGIESTSIAKDDFTTTSIWHSQVLHVTTHNNTELSKQAHIINSDGSRYFTTPLTNTSLSVMDDKYLDNTFSLIARSPTLSSVNDEVLHVTPTIYSLDLQSSNKAGDVFGIIPGPVHHIEYGVIYTETYGQMHIRQSRSNNNIDVFYFDPSTPVDEEFNANEMMYMFSYTK